MKSENKSRSNTCSYEKRIKHVKRKQSATTYSKLASHIATWELVDAKIMVHGFAVSYFLFTYLRTVPDRGIVWLA